MCIRDSAHCAHRRRYCYGWGPLRQDGYAPHYEMGIRDSDLIGTEIYEGDVCNEESLEPLFATQDGEELIVIHCAGIVSIASGYHKIVYDVNVSGTRNVVDCCIKHHVKKLVYVSSVHAIPEKPKGEIITEISHFDPGQVVGLYAKTKSEATQIVLNAAAEGLDASVVHPSGICGPYDYGRGHITQLFKDCLLYTSRCV